MIAIPHAPPFRAGFVARAQTWRIVAGALVLLALLLRLLPGQPRFMPGALDAAHQWAISVAASNSMAFGREIIFTYGPYGDLSNRLYDPSLRGMQMAGSALLAAAYAAGIMALARAPVAILFAAVLPLAGTNDAFAFTLGLPALLACARAAGNRARSALPPAVMLLAPALALLPFVKLSFVPFSVMDLGVVAWLLVTAGRLRLAGLFVLVFAASLPAAWAASGQRLGDLAAYFSNGLALIDGYGMAMSRAGPADACAAALGIGGAIFALAAFGARNLPRRAALPLLAAVACMVFVTVKAGFVRQDAGHVPEAVEAVGLALIILAAWLPGWRVAVLSAVAGVAVLGGPLSPVGLPGGGVPAWPGVLAELRGTSALLLHPAAFAAAHRHGTEDFPPLPWHPPGTADIYSYCQSALFASGLAWSPRPVFQSYSAYTPMLARLNAAHLLGPDAAENIFFRPEPIDDHLPALEDGASWPALLSLYAPAGYDPDSDLAWLTRDGSARPAAAEAAPVVAGRRALGETVALPDGTDLWATVAVAPSLAGRVVGVLGRSPPLFMTLHLSDGGTRSFRFVPGMAEAGFLLSPLVLTAADFLRLRPAPGQYDTVLPRVTAFSLDAPASTLWLWRRQYRLAISRIAFPARKAGLALERRPARVTLPPASARPDCYVDLINGAAATDAPVMAGASMTADGWGAFDAAAGVAADRAALAFVAESGEAWAVPVRLRNRGDVGPVFHHPGLLRVGFRAGADLSALPPGRYRVRVILRHGGDGLACATRVTLIVPARA